MMTLRKKLTVIFFVVIFSASATVGGEREISLFAAEDPYKIISSQQDLDEVIYNARQLLLQLAITIKRPVRAFLVTGQKLDELYAGAYRGAEIGLYKNAMDHHEIYMMADMGKDRCTITATHELVHAWQAENCPRDQDVLVKEGFACWVEYKIAQKTGAYVLARDIMEHADPVYGVGFKRMLELEDQSGEVGLVLKVRNMKKLNE